MMQEYPLIRMLVCHRFTASTIVSGGGGDNGGKVVTHLPPSSEVGGSDPKPYVVKIVILLLMVGSLQYRNLTNCMYWFTLPIKLFVMI